MSKVMFILTANDTSAIPYPLLDRMEIIKIDGYTSEEKVQIAKRQLIPKMLKETGLTKKEISISDSAINNIIKHHTRESGVRGLKRNIEKICRKTLLSILQKNKTKAMITTTNLHKYVGHAIHDTAIKPATPLVGVSIGLAYTGYGGCILPIEAIKIPGKNKQLTFTGNLGDIMKESVENAYRYIISNADKINISNDIHEKFDIHIHFPEGAVPKDGPSAGSAIITAIVSLLTKREISNDIAMTGEINLRGCIMPIGGVKEKILAAKREDISRVLIPKDNMRELQDLPKKIRKDLCSINIIPVEHIQEVLQHALIKKDTITDKTMYSDRKKVLST